MECLSWQVLNISCETCYIQVLLFGKISACHDCLECWPTHLRSQNGHTQEETSPTDIFIWKSLKRFTYLKTSPIHYISRGFFIFYWKVYERHENELFFLLNLPMDRHANNILNFLKNCETKENLTKEEYQRKYINLVSKKNWFLTYPIP